MSKTELYNTLEQYVNRYPNDSELGREVRKLLLDIKKEESSKQDNQIKK